MQCVLSQGRDVKFRHDRLRASAWLDCTKRLLDVLFAVSGLIFFLPVLVICGIWVKFIDGGPVFYRQWRVRGDGWFFCLYKLRTMQKDAERPGAAQCAVRADSRILPGCRLMRKSHVDELPQLWNVLCGHMSLVGPRPERPEMIEMLRPSLPKIERRLAIRPGLTGLAQISNGYTNDVAGARRKLAFDLQYLRRRSLITDLQLLLRTIPKVWDQAAL